MYASSLEPVPTTFSSLEKALIRRFGKTEDEKMDFFYKMTQKGNQSLYEYGDQLRRASQGM